jgi:gliding motility-associated-like protein
LFTGAAYNAGGLCIPGLPPGFSTCVETNVRAESPAFSTLGQSNINFDFNYIANGDGLVDNASVYYNAGAGWVLLTNTIKSPICASGQGEWSRYSVVLPAVCDNNPAVQVGINWTNNDDGVGTDPSVAIDSVNIYAVTGGSSLVYCVDSATIVVGEPTAINTTVDSFTNPLCFQSNDGTISVTATGGTPGYSYLWSDGSTNEDAVSLAPTDIGLTVTDANGCTDTIQQRLIVFNPITLIRNSVTPNSCVGNPDGAVSVTRMFGAPAITYLWNTGQTTLNLTNVRDGDYTLVATDGNGCIDTIQARITPSVVLVPTDVTTNALCAGQSGSSTITVSGGTGSYTFDWGASSTSTTNTAILGGGLHVVTITDSGNGCTGVDSISVTVPLPLTLNTTVTNVSCSSAGAGSDGAIATTVTGGTTAYSYNWSNGMNMATATGLTAGIYNITVTDANNCTITNTDTVIGAVPVVVTIDTLVGMLGCDLVANGSLEAQAVGGTSFAYSWSNGITTAANGGLGAGSYTVVATNTDGCSDSATVVITAPSIPTLDAYVSVTGVTSDTIQPGDNITIYANGGTGQSYTWTGAGVGNPNIATPNTANSVVAPDAQGTYTYIVTSDITTNGTTCSVMDTVFVTVEPAYVGMADAFTPNGDGLNDLFRPITLRAEDIIQFRVYNRFGQQVYLGDDLDNNGWDGTLNGVAQPRDVYIYVLEYKRATDRIAKTIRGRVTLLR